jgi:protein SCO1/2
VGPGWTFLTGKKEDIVFLGRRLGLYTTPTVNTDGHIAHLLIGNDAIGQWVRSSALDNPSFQARMIGDFLDNFKHDNPAQQVGSTDGSALKNFDKGKYLFGKDCIACHTIGHGDKIGPDLLGVNHVRNRQWLTQIIQHPDQLLEKDPIATALLKKYNVRMPNVYVSDIDADLIIRYIEEQTAAQEKQASNGNVIKVAAQ